MVRFDRRQTMKTTILLQPILFKNETIPYKSMNSINHAEWFGKRVWSIKTPFWSNWQLEIQTSRCFKVWEIVNKCRSDTQVLDDQAGGFSVVGNSATGPPHHPPPKWCGIVECSTPVWFIGEFEGVGVDFNHRRAWWSPIVTPRLGGDELWKVARSVVLDQNWSEGAGVGTLTRERKHGVSFELIVMSFWFLFL